MKRDERDGLVRLSDDRALVTLRRPAPYVELLRGEGYVGAEFAREILESREMILHACGKIALFDDLQDVTGYDSEVRLQLTTWSRKNRERIVAFHILTTSKVVQMGVAAASLTLGGGIKAHTKRRAFETALSKVVGHPVATG
jgi:hypothetical protein